MCDGDPEVVLLSPHTVRKRGRVVCIRVFDDDWLLRLDLYAAMHGVSRSEVIREAVEEYLSKRGV